MRRNPWLAIGLDAFALGVEASTVIGLRTVKLSRGGSQSAAEASLMVREKLAAAGELNLALLTGGLGSSPSHATRKTLAFYRKKVAANRRRLTRAL